MTDRRDQLAHAVADYLGCSPGQLTDDFGFEEYGADIGDVKECILRGNRALRTTVSEDEASSVATFGRLWRKFQDAKTI